MKSKARTWAGRPPVRDDFNDPIEYEFVDGRTKFGPWALMSPRNWTRYGCGQFGTGYGQRYRCEPSETIWRKVEG